VRRWSIRVCAAAIGLVAIVPSATASAAGWIGLGSSVTNATASIAVDGQGDLWLATTDQTTEHIVIDERVPGGSLTQVADLARPGAGVAQITAGADGTVAVFWREGNPSEDEVAVRPPGGTFGTPTALTTTSPASDGAACAVLSDGTVLLAYRVGAPANTLMLATRPPGAASTFSTAAMPGQDASAMDPVIAADGSGRAAIMWTDVPATPNTIRVAEVDRAPNGTIGAVNPVATRLKLVSEMGQAYVPAALTFDASGDLAVAWRFVSETAMFSGTTFAQASVRPAGATAFPAGQFLDMAEAGPTGPGLDLLRAAFDASGALTLVWESDLETPTSELHTATAAPPTYAFPATPTTLVSDPSLHGVALAELAGGGDISLAVTETALPFVRAPGAASPFTAGPALSTMVTANLPELAADPFGNAFASYEIAGMTDSSNQLAAYDATPPTVGAIGGAGTASAGAPVALSVSSSDTLSPAITTAWSFGDGHSSTGASVSRTWSSPGHYPVSVTVTDGSGNTATASATETVRDTTAPAFAHAKLSRTRFAVSSTPTATTAAHHRPPNPTGTTIEFSLSEPARVTAKITHTTAGRKSGHTCVATRKHVVARLRCTATVADGTLTRAKEKTGADRIGFTGRIGRRALGLGRHSLVLGATDAAGNVARTATLRFTILARS
jgi:PKD domain-containing protein